MRTIRSSAVAIAAAVLLAGPGRVGAGGAEQRRVVVADFTGQGASPRVARDSIVKIVSDFYEVLPNAQYRIARRRLNVTQDSTRTMAEIARKVGADVIVEGEIKGRELTVSVREGRTGRVIDRFKVTVQERGVSESTRERITDELVDLIDWAEPIAERDELGAKATPAVIGDPADDAAPRASLAAAQAKTAAVTRKWSADREPARPAAAERRPPVRVRGAVGVAATARQLQFSHQADLAEDQRPVGMSGSPSAGVAVAGTLDVDSLGLSADAMYQRSIGASVSFPSGGQTKQLAIALSHIGARVLAGRAVGRRVTVRGGVGYHQLSFSVAGRPVGLTLPDSRYSFLDVGGGARLGLRDDRIALTGELSYLHVLTAGGITDASAYGSSHFQGLGGEVGLEIQTSDTTFLRLAGTYQRIILAFNGDGAWSTGLDESSDVDVSGAADTFIGWAVMLGFRL